MKKIAIVLGLLVAAQSFCPSEAYARKEKKDKKTLVYVIGDSTVKNGQAVASGDSGAGAASSESISMMRKPKSATGPSEAVAAAPSLPRGGGTSYAIRCGKAIMSLYNSAITTGENSLPEIVPGPR